MFITMFRKIILLFLWQLYINNITFNNITLKNKISACFGDWMQITSLHYTGYKAEFLLNVSVGSTSSFNPIVSQCFLDEEKKSDCNKYVTNQSLKNLWRESE